MNNGTLTRGMEIRKEIDNLNAEIDLLPIKTHKRTLKRFINGIFKRNHNNLYVVQTYTYSNEVVLLDEDDMNCLIQLRRVKVKKLEEELNNL